MPMPISQLPSGGCARLASSSIPQSGVPMT
jgi:hypothetical protein